MASRLAMYARFISGMPAFLRQRVTPEMAREEVCGRLASREDNFLRLVREAVFERPASPYLFLFRDAGTEFGDIERLVREDGLDMALEKMSDAGIRVSFNEFKGRAPLTRSGRTFEGNAESFDNPLAAHTYESESSGTTGIPSTVRANLAHIGSQIPMLLMGQVANATLGHPVILYRPGMPCTVAYNTILRHIVIGNPVRRWFSPVTAAATNSPIRFRVAGAVTPALVRACGESFPRREHVPYANAIVVARAAAALAAREGGCIARCPVSSALAVALASAMRIA